MVNIKIVLLLILCIFLVGCSVNNHHLDETDTSSVSEVEKSYNFGDIVPFDLNESDKVEVMIAVGIYVTELTDESDRDQICSSVNALTLKKCESPHMEGGYAVVFYKGDEECRIVFSRYYVFYENQWYISSDSIVDELQGYISKYNKAQNETE